MFQGLLYILYGSWRNHKSENICITNFCKIMLVLKMLSCNVVKLTSVYRSVCIRGMRVNTVRLCQCCWLNSWGLQQCRVKCLQMYYEYHWSLLIIYIAYGVLLCCFSNHKSWGSWHGHLIWWAWKPLTKSIRVATSQCRQLQSRIQSYKHVK